MVRAMSNSPQIYVDADACPVKAEVLKVAERHGLATTFVANSGLRPSRDPMVTNVIVSGVSKGAHVTGPTGRLFDVTNIGMATAMRDLGAHLRETGESKGYNAAFTPRDRSAFLETLERLCRRAKSERAASGAPR